MSVTMFHGENEIEVQEHSVNTMLARGWTNEKPSADPDPEKSKKKAADAATKKNAQGDES